MDGFVNLDKDSGISSQQAVAALRRLFACKAGHAGTLDPLATGVLPVCLGKATRLSEYVMGRDKQYVARIRFGVETDSYDAAGAVVAVADASHVRRQDIEALLPRFCGVILQKPPLISAIKRGGQPLYQRARRGEQLEIEARPVEIQEVELLEGEFGSATPSVELRIACGKGVYIRSIAHDLGEMLGVGAHVAALRRLQVGPFQASEAYTLRQIQEMFLAGDTSFLLPLHFGLAYLPRWEAPAEALTSLLHGNAWRLAEAEAAPLVRVETAEGVLLGLGRIEAQEQGGYRLHMDKVLSEPPGPPYSVVAIGNFDGLHVGHQELMRRMRRQKERLGGKSAVLTFHPHPLTLITGQAPPLLTTAAEKRSLLVASGATDELVELPFDEQLRHSSPQHFVEEVVIGRAGARQVVVGFNFRFGAQGAGDAQLLQSLCAARGVGVEIVEAVSGPYGLVSSSNIRKHLQAGDMEAVNSMLGYCYSLSGQVVKGQQLGRQLGFPTANFPPPADKALPPYGVYAARVAWQGQVYDSVVNLGFKPTLGSTEAKLLVEAHLFDVEPELYGENLTVYLLYFLRGERRFADLTELKAQITADSMAARRLLYEANHHPLNPLDPDRSC